MTIQEQIIDALANKLSNDKDWREKIADKLYLSKSTVYKRLNGITPFTSEEIAILIAEFGISFDAIALEAHHNRVIFKVPPTHQRIHNFDEYLAGVANTFRPVEHLSNVKVFVMTRDLPLFYYFIDTDVLLFNLYAYGRFLWDIDSCISQPLSLDTMALIPNLQQRVNKIWDKYASLATVEFWQTGALDVTLQQLQYLSESGAVPTNDAHRVLDGLTRIVAFAKKMSQNGHKTLSDKTNGESLELFHNRIMSTENMILATTTEQNALHIVLDPTRFIVTFDAMMTQTAYHSIQHAKKNAYFLGEGTGNVREEFFNIMNRKIDQMRKKIDLQSQVIGF